MNQKYLIGKINTATVLKLLLLMICMVLFQTSSAQIAVIEDKDGYTNVRQQATTNSKVVHTIKENEVFFIGEQNKGWTEIQTSKDEFSFDVVRKGQINGYVHNSRIRSFEKLPQATTEECGFQYQTKPFTAEGKTIQMEGDAPDSAVDRINEDYFWGTDGELPKVEIQSLKISINGKEIAVPEKLLLDIYQVRNDFTCYKVDDLYYVHNLNSDGAGYYEIVWVFNQHGVVQRLVGTLN